MRWNTPEGGTFPLSLDPGYPILLDAFSEYAAGNGFSRSSDMNQPAYVGIAGSIERRFYKEEQAFPLLQIGPGVYAANESYEYDWEKFYPFVLDGALFIISHYPYLRQQKFSVKHLELRYIDSFEESLIGSTEMLTFLQAATNVNVSLPFLKKSKLVNSDIRGRIHFETGIKKLPGSVFGIDFASGLHDSNPIVRFETKVVLKGEDLLQLNSKNSEVRLARWLERAHTVTSESFRSIIKPAVFDKFKVRS